MTYIQETNNIQGNQHVLIGVFSWVTGEEIKNLDLFEDNKNTITLIEWPQMIKEKPENLIELVFEYGIDHQIRSVKIRGLEL